MRIGFLSDVHGNREALEVGLRALARRDVAEIHFLGDAVGYLPETSSIRRIVESGATSIMGNHEAMLLSDDIDPDLDAIYQLGRVSALLHEEDLRTIEGWPSQRTLETAGGTALLVHGSPADPTHGYVYPDADLARLGSISASLVFMGNTHRPFVRQEGATTWVNVGSCGLPRDDGRYGSAAVLETETGDVTIVRFDIREATAAALVRCRNVAEAVHAVFARRAEGLVGSFDG